MHSAVNSVGMRIRERRYEWEGPAVAAVLAVGSHRNEKKSRRGHDIKKYFSSKMCAHVQTHHTAFGPAIIYVTKKQKGKAA